MKKLTVIVAMLSLATLSFGQRLMPGETQLNAGFGFNSGDWEIPIYVGVDYGVHPDVTVGGILSYSSADIKYHGDKDDGTWLSIGARGDYHFNTILEIPNNWDVYAGLTLAYNNFSYDHDWDGYDYDDSGIGLAAQIGGRYYFQDNFAINLEFGGGNIASGGKIGITYKF
ncbi:outer membrane protein with beta-barrel domain [Balneicella halophila]|uniref:Outer membrane protein with beta-barrel domain n=1 Tax=Balneicella halophila TaxID=1537566 RepID=A0A7L4UR95_BALHA|nr:outer membrane beta-barrel protein [Balneicella halophila]PVX52286.1 outer membrane protein with beta-barrel domain [Balneicella halophila]